MDTDTRIRRLERTNRVLCLGLALAIALPLLLAAQKAAPGPLVGTSLAIVDDKGKERISASAFGGTTGLLLKNANGRVMVWISGDDTGPAITVGNDKESGLVQITQDRGKDGQIQIRSAKGEWIFDTAKKP